MGENKVWSTEGRRLRDHSEGAFRDAVGEAAALHARGEPFAKHITPEPVEEGPPVWAMAESTNDEDDAAHARRAARAVAD